MLLLVRGEYVSCNAECQMPNGKRMPKPKCRIATPSTWSFSIRTSFGICHSRLWHSPTHHLDYDASDIITKTVRFQLGRQALDGVGLFGEKQSQFLSGQVRVVANDLAHPARLDNQAFLN